ncbi:hypothetical protein AMTR_s00001p00208910 [Amborella trichopoda]|uniref:Uncharacterized protein n=1 Tax=Amborella trichopoda TaxID=13333 RepID=W1NLH2_AMBTC|nr:hypothetical protein AMTR_s00001p00208910 [Amborella trichopoda]
MEGVRNCIYKLEPDLEDGVYAVVDMDDNADVAASNEGDIAVDMDTDCDDYTQDEDEVHDDEKTDGTMENDWQDLVVQECEGAQHDAVPDD